MTAKEKAEELLDKYHELDIQEVSKYSNGIVVGLISKQCALIAVDEILSEYDIQSDGYRKFLDSDRVNYWQEVKNEIEKL